MKRVAIGVQLLIVLVAQFNFMVAADKELLQKLCSNHANTEVTSIAQIQSLIATLEEGTELKVCKDEAKQSILDLRPIIEIENVCSLSGVQQLAKYYQDHVHKRMLKFKQDKEVRRTPSGIRKFFIAYGLQASKLCRENLVQNLASASRAYIPVDDMNFVTGWIDDDDRNYKILRGDRPRLEDLVLLGDVVKNSMRKRGRKPERQSVDVGDEDAVVGTAVSADNKAKIDDMKARCAQKFKPIYDQLIVPVVQLSSLGFNYTDARLAHSMRQLEDSAEYRSWFKAVFVCDSILRMKVVSINGDRSNNKAAALLTEDEFARAQRMANLGNSSEPSILKPIINFESIVRIDTTKDILDSSDGQLVSLVNNYNPRVANCGAFLARAAKNLPALLETYMKTGAIRFGLKDVSGDRLKEPTDASKFGRAKRRLSSGLKWFVRAATLLAMFSAAAAIFTGMFAGAGQLSMFVPIGLAIGTLVLLIITGTGNAAYQAVSIREWELSNEYME